MLSRNDLHGLSIPELFFLLFLPLLWRLWLTGDSRVMSHSCRHTNQPLHISCQSEGGRLRQTDDACFLQHACCQSNHHKQEEWLNHDVTCVVLVVNKMLIFKWVFIFPPQCCTLYSSGKIKIFMRQNLHQINACVTEHCQGSNICSLNPEFQEKNVT